MKRARGTEWGRIRNARLLEWSWVQFLRFVIFLV
jgi:hypothetical protein